MHLGVYTTMRNQKRQEQIQPWILQRADPHVYKHDNGEYYFTASVPSYDAIILRKAKSLEALAYAEEVIVWKKHEAGIMGAHIWAPEIHYIYGKWYIYFAAGEAENIWEIRPYVLECEDPDPVKGTWVEKGKMQCSDEDEFSFRSFSLDATVFNYMEKYYFIWAEKVGVGKQISSLYIAEMENPWKLKSTQVLLTTPDYDWERVGFWVNEGPSVLIKEDKIFITYSASETGLCYCVGMLTASITDDLLDPASWKKERLPVLKTEEVLGIYGPGHNSFTKDEEGNDIMVYHARTEEELQGNPLYNPNRHAFLLKVDWSKDNQPFFNVRNQP